MTLSFGSLFSGVGGFEIGLERAGLRPAWQVEIDPDAQRVLRHHWPDTDLHADVRKCGRKNLAAVDVICGGWPCQDVSIAGKQAGLAGERSGLFFQMMRVVHALRPRVCVFENVPGLYSSPPENPGADFEAVLQAVADLRVYECGWTGLDCQWFGLAQRRRRVFIVLTRRDLGAGRAAEILALAEGRRRHPPARRQAEAGLAAAVTGGVGRVGSRGADDGANIASGPIGSLGNGRGWNGDLDRAGAYVAWNWREDDTSPKPQSPALGTLNDVAVYQCHGSNVGPMGAVRRGNGSTTGGVPFIINAAESCATKSHARPSDVARCLDQTGGFAANQGGTVVGFTPIDMRQASRGGTMTNNRAAGSSGGAPGTGVGQDGDPAPTLAETHIPAVAHGMIVRRLMPVECLRLQGFSDDWLDLDPPLSDSAKYRLIGNAVPVPVAEWLGRRIVTALEHA
jgi:DNA (cytosine-5)-methyltransferase 1